MPDKMLRVIREIGWIVFTGAGAILWVTFLPDMKDNTTKILSYICIASLSLSCLLSVAKLIVVVGGIERTS